MEIPFAARIDVPSTVLMREIDGEAVILNLDSEKYFGLNQVGARLWGALITAPSIQAAYETLLELYDVPPDRLREDMQSLIGDLVEHGLVTLGKPIESMA